VVRACAAAVGQVGDDRRCRPQRLECAFLPHRPPTLREWAPQINTFELSSAQRPRFTLPISRPKPPAGTRGGARRKGHIFFLKEINTKMKRNHKNCGISVFSCLKTLIITSQKLPERTQGQALPLGLSGLAPGTVRVEALICGRATKTL